jgi:hypothetical protein
MINNHRPASERPLHRNGRGRLAFIAALVALVATLAIPALAVQPVPATGVMVLANRTVPRGLVFIPDDLGGHWWASDNGAGTGLCRIDGAPAASPPWTTNWCNGTVRGGGQIVVGDTPTTATDGSKYIYVADDSTKSVQVVRLKFNPHATATQNPISSSLTMTVANLTAVGGGTAGGRPSGVALGPNGKDLYVGYLKSGDIMKITDAMHATSGSPSVARVASTSDGRGVNSLAMLKGNLYAGELGGVGVSAIDDISGVNGRPACSASATCTAITVANVAALSSSPGGMATDGSQYVYVADAPRTGAGTIKRWDPVAGTIDVISRSVQPYTDTFSNVQQSQYTGPVALGLAPNGEIYVGDDPTVAAGAVTAGVGHIFRLPAPSLAVNPPAVTNIAPTSGTTAGGDVVTITGTGFDPAAGATTVAFGNKPATAVNCTTATQCTATSPAGSGTVDVIVSVGGQASAATGADRFTYVAPPANGGLAVTAVSPATGATSGGTTVTVTGAGFDTTPGATTITFGPNPATQVNCASATVCTALSPRGGAGTHDVQASTAVGGTSPIVPSDAFTYKTPVADLYAWGITAPKGGAVWLPNADGTSGHWWSSDHSQGLCRQDAAPTSGPLGVPGNTLHALNYGVCADDVIGSAGQAVYDPRPFPPTATGCPAADVCHYVYVPDNAVKSVAVWRQVYDATTQAMVGTAAGMVPLADLRTLKPNGMALGPLDASGQPVADAKLYVSDLTEANIRAITSPQGDPRSQTVSIIAQTGDGRGANGTMGFIRNRLFISENRGTAYVDVLAPCVQTSNCATQKIALDAPAAGIFVAGTATDPVRGYIYVADSPGAANATIYRFNASTITAANPAGSPAPVLLTDGRLPASGSPNATVFCSTACQRPWDTTNHPTVGGVTGFAFVFGLSVGPNGDLIITEDPSAGARSARGTMWDVPFIP